MAERIKSIERMTDEEYREWFYSLTGMERSAYNVAERMQELAPVMKFADGYANREASKNVSRLKEGELPPKRVVDLESWALAEYQKRYSTGPLMKNAESAKRRLDSVVKPTFLDGPSNRGASDTRMHAEPPSPSARIAAAQSNPKARAKDRVAGTIIDEYEGYSDEAYWDVNAWRIGFGSDTHTNPDGSTRRVRKGDRTTHDAAVRDLQRRIPEFQKTGIIPYVGQAAWDKLPPGAKDVITSIAYNYGSLQNLRSLTEAIKVGDGFLMANSIARYASHNDGINAKRRKEEARLLLESFKGNDHAAVQGGKSTPIPQKRPDNLDQMRADFGKVLANAGIGVAGDAALIPTGEVPGAAPAKPASNALPPGVRVATQDDFNRSQAAKDERFRKSIEEGGWSNGGMFPAAQRTVFDSEPVYDPVRKQWLVSETGKTIDTKQAATQRGPSVANTKSAKMRFQIEDFLSAPAAAKPPTVKDAERLVAEKQAQVNKQNRVVAFENSFIGVDTPRVNYDNNITTKVGVAGGGGTAVGKTGLTSTPAPITPQQANRMGALQSDGGAALDFSIPKAPKPAVQRPSVKPPSVGNQSPTVKSNTEVVRETGASRAWGVPPPARPTTKAATVAIPKGTEPISVTEARIAMGTPKPGFGPDGKPLIPSVAAVPSYVIPSEQPKPGITAKPGALAPLATPAPLVLPMPGAPAIKPGLSQPPGVPPLPKPGVAPLAAPAPLKPATPRPHTDSQITYAPPPPPREVFKGSSTGREYVVGERYTTGAGESYVAQSGGSFKNERTGRTAGYSETQSTQSDWWKEATGR